jgi:hypothetical protein
MLVYTLRLIFLHNNSFSDKTDEVRYQFYAYVNRIHVALIVTKIKFYRHILGEDC